MATKDGVPQLQSKEDISKLKVTDIQGQLESRGLDTTGKKSELVQRLWEVVSHEQPGDREKEPVNAQQSEIEPNTDSGTKAALEAQVLRTKLRLISERQQIEEQQSRLRARTEQIELQIKLAELTGGEVDEGVELVNVNSGAREQPASDDAKEALTAQVKRTLLPPSELQPFAGDLCEFRLWRRSFEARIGSRTQDENELLYYLHQYTKGVPNQLVTSCMYRKEGGFQEAMRLLEDRYGNHHRVIDEYYKRLRDWPKIQSEDISGIDSLVLFLREISSVMQDLEAGEFDHPRSIRWILGKLPTGLHDRFLRLTDTLMEFQGKSVKLMDMIDFLAKEVRIKRNPVFGSSKVDDTSPKRVETKAHSGTVKTHRINAIGAVRDVGCKYCGGPHFIGRCNQLQWRPIAERQQCVRDKRLCWSCLCPDHVAKFCARRLTCEICNKQHPTILHRYQGSNPVGQSAGAQYTNRAPPITAQHANRAPPTTATAAPGTSGSQSTQHNPTVVNARIAMAGTNGHAYMPIVAVKVRSQVSGKVVLCNAFIDGGSSGCFGTEELARRLETPGRKTTVSVDTVCGRKDAISSSMLESIMISPIDGADWRSLPTVFTLRSLAVNAQDKFPPSELQKWPHLADVDLPQVTQFVDLLIGANAPQLHVASEVRVPESGCGPHGIRTWLGWYVIGVAAPEGSRGAPNRYMVNFLRVQQAEPVTDDKISPEKLEIMFRQMYDSDFGDIGDDRTGLSVEDREWLDEVEPMIRVDDSGHFEVGIPKHDVSNLPDSLSLAEKRFRSLQQKFQRDPSYFEEYRSVVQGLLNDGYAEEVPENEVSAKGSFYVPHFAVSHPEKTKLRVVFDCQAKVHDKSGRLCSLNDLLKKGPNLTNSLLGVLLRFREGGVAFTSDIEAMFHQIHLPPSDANLFRFLWFKGSEVNGKVQIYRMTSHVFGAVSSPSVAGLALLQCAKKGREKHPEAAKVLEKNSYVDDALVARDSVSDAVKIAFDLRELCENGGFNMTKFSSNDSGFLGQIPAEHVSKKVSLEMDREPMGSQKALGMKWVMQTDTFEYEFREFGRPVTRRGILGTVSSVFDPLQVTGPTVLQGKSLLQKLCSEQCGWDDDIPEHLQEEWSRWLTSTGTLDSVKLDRDITGPPGKVVSTQLHVFSDASEVGFCSVAYIRREVQSLDGETQVFVRFIMSKCLVNPIRFVSIPRLELAASVVGVKIRGVILRELDIEFERVYMWTDSMVVLSYIRNRTTRFKTYVANRLEYIHSNTEVSEWGHVRSESNPADIGSRGCVPGDLEGLWLEGPPFLRGEPETWPEEPPTLPAVPLEEVKKSAVVAALRLNATDKTPTDKLLEYYSSLFRLKKAVGWFRKFFGVLKDGSFRRVVLLRRRGLRQRNTEIEKRLSVKDIADAERGIIRYTQQQNIAEYPTSLVDGVVSVKKGTPLACLNPHVQEGVLVVGGRLNRSAQLSDRAKHPVILPRHSHVTQLVIRAAHIEVGHEGRDHTFWHVRSKFWIIGAGPLIKEYIHTCVTCRRVNSLPQQQQMSDLPRDRVTAGEKAFHDINIDVFGPFVVKHGRSERKRYGLVCLCSQTRAVHFEVLTSLSTDSLINAIRRIAARRGKISMIRSDMGTNMTGANKELGEALREVNFDQVHSKCLELGIEWVFNPPTASHFGGSHERAIRSFRKVWRSMPVQSLDDEGLQTLFCEIEAILNARPLNYVTTPQGSVEPLTPSHLLLFRGGAVPIAGRFSEADSISRKRWRQVQYLASQFWLRWASEYAAGLQNRQKWTHTSRNLVPGDVVLVLDKDLPRAQWPMGKVVETYPSADQLVRKVSVKMANSVLIRPIHKLVLIMPCTDL